ncbi:MAG: hypothetical protein IPP69_10800 [Flavobacteriales bacterium]|nr:hypothetical protein [Flavobacteriales bacterium]
MLPLHGKIFLVLIFIFFGETRAQAQTEHWYVLQVVGQMDEAELKSAMSYIQQVAPGTSVWYNDSRSNTIGCKSTIEISWPQVISELRAHDFFLADVTKCRCHSSDVNAITSIFFIEACYYASHADNIPQGWIARLNKSEFDALPEGVRDFYEDQGNYELVNK